MTTNQAIKTKFLEEKLENLRVKFVFWYFAFYYNYDFHQKFIDST